MERKATQTLAIGVLAALGLLLWQTCGPSGNKTLHTGEESRSRSSEQEVLPPLLPTNPTPIPEPQAPSGIDHHKIAPTDPGSRSPGVLLYGAILNTDGERIEKGYLRLEDEQSEVVTTQISSAGSYSMIGLTPGSWTLHGRCSEHYNVFETFEIPTGVAHHRQDITLQKAIFIRIRFENEVGVSYEELITESVYAGRHPSLIATVNPPPSILPDVVSARAAIFDGGRYYQRNPRKNDPRLAPGDSGILELTIPPPVLVSATVRNVVLESRTVHGPQDFIVFVIPQEQYRATFGGLRLMVVHPNTGASWAAPSVSVSNTGGSGRPRKTDDRGVVGFSDLLPGLYEIRFHHKEVARTAQYVRVHPGTVTDLGSIAPGLPARVTGKIVDENDRGVSARITYKPLAFQTMVHDTDSRMQRESDEEGGFSLFHVAQGKALCIVERKDLALTPVHLNISGNLVEDVVVRVEESIPVTFIVPTSVPFGTRLGLVDDKGAYFWSQKMIARSNVSVRLSRGNYEARLCEDEYVRRSIPFTVDGEALAIELE